MTADDQPTEPDTLPTLTAEQVPGSEAWVIRADDHLWSVASVSGGTIGAGPLARLFAAAPNLLAACRLMADAEDMFDLSAAVEAADAAIAKATGAE